MSTQYGVLCLKYTDYNKYCQYTGSHKMTMVYPCLQMSEAPQHVKLKFNVKILKIQNVIILRS